MNQVIGLKSKTIYFEGDGIACRRFINQNSLTRKSKKGGEKKSTFGFSEALRIIECELNV